MYSNHTFSWSCIPQCLWGHLFIKGYTETEKSGSIRTAGKNFRCQRSKLSKAKLPPHKYIVVLFQQKSMQWTTWKPLRFPRWTNLYLSMALTIAKVISKNIQVTTSSMSTFQLSQYWYYIQIGLCSAEHACLNARR